VNINLLILPVSCYKDNKNSSYFVLNNVSLKFLNIFCFDPDEKAYQGVESHSSAAEKEIAKQFPT
jgi:hypothetical protein